jgi:hypothetical protein
VEPTETTNLHGESICQRIRHDKIGRPLEPVTVLVPNQGSRAQLHRNLCQEFGAIANVSTLTVAEFLQQRFDSGGRKLLSDARRLVAIIQVLADPASEQTAPHLYALRDSFALIDKLNSIFGQLGFFSDDEIARLLKLQGISPAFRQCLSVYIQCRRHWRGEFYEEAEPWRSTLRQPDGILLSYNLKFAARRRCLEPILDSLLPPENRFNDPLANNAELSVTRNSNPDAECVWAAQHIISILADGHAKPHEIGIAFNSTGNYQQQLRLYLNEANIANSLRSTIAVKSLVDYVDLGESLTEQYLAGQKIECSLQPPSASASTPEKAAHSLAVRLAENLQELSQAGVVFTRNQLLDYIESRLLNRHVATTPDGDGEIAIGAFDKLAGRSFTYLICLGLCETLAPLTFKPDALISFQDIELVYQTTGKDALVSLQDSIALQTAHFKLLTAKSEQVLLSVPAQNSKGLELSPSRWLDDVTNYDSNCLEKPPPNKLNIIDAACDEYMLSERYFQTKYNLTDERVRAARDLYRDRNQQVWSAYNGIVQHPALNNWFKAWSASMFELYADNPLDFFFKNILGLPEPKDEEAAQFDELDYLDLGTFLHSCLERLTEQYRKSKTLEAPDIQHALIRTLKDLPNKHPDWLEKYPLLFAHLDAGDAESLFNGVLRDQMSILREKIERWRMHFQNEIEGYTPSTELTFSHWQDTSKPIGLLDGATIALDGRIDRCDTNDHTGAKRIIDYKSGKPQPLDPHDITAIGIGSKARSGRRFQLGLYALLASERTEGVDNLSDIESAQYQYFNCSDVPHPSIAAQEDLVASLKLYLVYVTLITRAVKAGFFPYKSPQYGSKYLVGSVRSNYELERLSRRLRDRYLEQLKDLSSALGKVDETRDGLVEKAVFALATSFDEEA